MRTSCIYTRFQSCWFVSHFSFVGSKETITSFESKFSALPEKRLFTIIIFISFSLSQSLSISLAPPSVYLCSNPPFLLTFVACFTMIGYFRFLAGLDMLFYSLRFQCLSVHQENILNSSFWERIQHWAH